MGLVLWNKHAWERRGNVVRIGERCEHVSSIQMLFHTCVSSMCIQLVEHYLTNHLDEGAAKEIVILTLKLGHLMD